MSQKKKARRRRRRPYELSAEGRDAISKAQVRRWKKYRLAKAKLGKGVLKAPDCPFCGRPLRRQA